MYSVAFRTMPDIYARLYTGALLDAIQNKQMRFPLWKISWKRFLPDKPLSFLD